MTASRASMLIGRDLRWLERRDARLIAPRRQPRRRVRRLGRPDFGRVLRPSVFMA
jgi:hypothetical protein